MKTATATQSSKGAVAAHSGAANARIVVAIDFGTSHSGFAYSHKADATTVEAMYQWDGAPHPYSKTLTAILYDGSGLPIDWGYSALQRYQRIKPSERNSYTFLRQFKLYLDESYVAKGNKVPEGFTEITLIGDYLRFMRIMIERTLKVKFGESFSIENVHWCLTVPAMWTDRAKHYTRKAAAFAEIVDEPTSDRLSIILEPEAAALYVSSTMKGSLKDGDIFMILDAGGGTVDLTVHQVREENGRHRFVEVAPGHGKSCGSGFVDSLFLEYFKRKVGEDVYKDAELERPEEIVQILKQWESIKRSFKGPTLANPTDRESITIPNKMLRYMPEDAVQMLAEKQDGFDDVVMISPEDMATFFDPIILEILELANEMRDRCPNRFIHKILCVGGFTESEYLVRRVREEFEGQGITVICPADPGATVVKGAVKFGLNPEAIAARRARSTYGLAVRGFWDESYPDSKKIWDRYQRQYMVEDKFDKLVMVGAEIPVNHVESRVYYPPTNWSDSIRLSLYASQKENPRLIDEEGCVQCAEIKIPLDLDRSKSINDYPIAINVRFGASEITITAINQQSNQVHQHDVNYDVKVCPTGAIVETERGITARKRSRPE